MVYVPQRRKIICIDLDGVVVDHVNGLQKEPRPGAVEALRRLTIEGWRIVICTARLEEEIPRIRLYLDLHGIFYDEVTYRKPRAHAYVDDRAVRFDGDWEKTLREIREFEPYYYRDVLGDEIETS